MGHKTVKKVYFDDDLNLPVFLLENGEKMLPLIRVDSLGIHPVWVTRAEHKAIKREQNERAAKAPSFLGVPMPGKNLLKKFFGL